MKKFSKFAAIVGTVVGLMAVTSMGALAEDTDPIVASILNPEGVVVDYTQAEIDALGGVIPAYDGMVVDFNTSEMPMISVSAARVSVNNYFSSDEPISGKAYNIYDSE